MKAGGKRIVSLDDPSRGRALIDRLAQSGWTLSHVKDEAEALALLEADSAATILFIESTLRDSLTGLHGRVAFEETLTAELGRALRDCRSLALLLGELDGTDQVSPEVLRRVADALSATISRPGDFLARVGLGRFAILLPGTHLEGASVVGEALRQTVEEQLRDSAVTVSFGVSAVDARQSTPSAAFLAAAEKALHVARLRGGNAVVEAALEGAKS